MKVKVWALALMLASAAAVAAQEAKEPRRRWEAPRAAAVPRVRDYTVGS